MAKDPECVTCQRTDQETDLQKCPVCFKHYCGEHSTNYSGRTFCSKHCAEYFFFADDDE